MLKTINEMKRVKLPSVKLSRRTVLHAITAILVIGLVLVLPTATKYLRDKHKDDGAKKYGTVLTACQILTQTSANSMMHNLAKQSGSTSLRPVAEGVRASQCTYMQQASSTFGEGGATAVLRLQSPTNKETVKQIAVAFQKTQKDLIAYHNNISKSKKPVATGGYSDNFWDSRKGEFNFLNKNVWYTVSFTPTGEDGDRNVPGSDKLATIVQSSIH
jgi:hypothetical protein